MATKSASNVLEMTPVSGQASASVKGTHGAAVGAELIKFLEDKAKAVVAEQKPLKMRLKAFYDFSDDDFDGYFATSRHYRDEIKKKADAAKLTITKFRQSAPGIDYVYVSLSEFDRLARAVKTGWRPDVDRLSWAAIKAEATERLDSVGKAEKRAAITKERDQIESDPSIDPEVKQARLTLLKKAEEELVPKTNNGPTKSTKTNFQTACEMLDKFPLQDLELVQAWLGQKIAKINEKAKTKTVKTESAPATKAATTKAKGKTKEHATARGSKK